METFQASVVDGMYSGMLIMSSLQGFVLAAILFFHARLKSRSNQFLALSLFAVSIVVLYDGLYYVNLNNLADSILAFLPIYLTSPISIGIYFFVTYLIHPKHQLTSWEKWWPVPIILEVFLQIGLIIINVYSESGTISISEKSIILIEQSIGLPTSLILIPLALKKVYHYHTFLFQNYSTIAQKDLKWLRRALLLKYGLTLLWLVSFIFEWAGFSVNLIYEILTLSLAIVLFGISYFLLLHYHLFQIVPIQTAERTQDNYPKKLSPKTDQYYDVLKDLMQNEALYKNSSLTLSMLAERLEISSGYLSQIINEKEQKNFFEFINHYRIEAVKSNLVDKKFDQYSIMGIASECGFSSKSAFNSVFKKLTGYTPSAYKKRHHPR
ncbi:MAG: helix-turn-helix domain-containing protein [Calditrichia bacterium]